MSTGLLIASGSDFDSLFQTGSGTQLFYIYTNAGVDVGQRYLPASSGTAYGTTNWKNANGTDIGTLLCKAGTASAGISWTAAVTGAKSDGSLILTLKIGFKRTGSNTSVTVTSASATCAGGYYRTDNGSDSGSETWISFSNKVITASGTVSGLTTNSFKYLTATYTLASSSAKYSYSSLSVGMSSFTMTVTCNGISKTVTGTSGSF